MNLRSFLACTSLLAALAFAAAPARADRDRVQFGADIVVPPGESAHDTVCFFCSVDAKGTVDHDIVVFFGDVHIASHANHEFPAGRPGRLRFAADDACADGILPR